MTEEPKTTSETPNQPGGDSQTNWQDVGQQLKELGESLAAAFRTTWENEENQRRMQGMRSGLESMVQEVGRAIDDTAKSPQGQRISEEAAKTYDKVRAASEQTVQEVRPQLINALQQLNTELQKLVDRMEAHRTPPAEKGNPSDPSI
jgi:hypothetical protein